MQRPTKIKPKKNKQLTKVVVAGRTKYVYSDALKDEFEARTGRRGCCGRK